MSWVSDIFSGGTAGVLQGAGSFAKAVREAITGKTIIDPAVMAEIALKADQLALAADQAKMDYETKMATLEADIKRGQIAINQVEASSSSLFVAGWRPAVGWVCVTGLAYTFLLRPLLPWIIGVAATVVGHPVAVAQLPGIEISELIVLLMGMLGLTVARSIDKYNKVTGPPNNQG